MSIQLILNWKTFAAIGFSAALITVAVKVDPSDAKEAIASLANTVAGLARIGGSEMQ